MADIVHYLIIKAPVAEVFRAISTPAGLDAWWTKRAKGKPNQDTEYNLWFGPESDWRASVSRCVPQTEFELELTDAHDDWCGTRVGFVLQEQNGATHVRFSHTGWPETNDHYQGSCYCWAMYLRLLKRYLETGETVPYENRLDA